MMTIEIDPVVDPDLWRRRLVKPLLGYDLIYLPRWRTS
jgi:hypothetical protein